MRFHIITILPESFDSYLKESIIGRAIKNKLIKIDLYNPRDFASPAKLQRSRVKADGWFYKQVDDKPYGGGPGMIMQAEPILKAVDKIMTKITKRFSRSSEGGQPDTRKSSSNLQSKVKIVIFAPSAKKFTNTTAQNFSKKYTDIILICGRYEGIDARVKKILKAEEISIGDYVVTGGELPAMILVDCISRQIKGVLNKQESLEEGRTAGSAIYTRPEVLNYKGKNYKVPKVLTSGNHALIEEWKRKNNKK